MSEAAPVFFGKERVLLEPILGQGHWQTGLVEEAIRRLEATMTATAPEHPDMGHTNVRTSSGRLQGKSTRAGRQVLHTRIRVTSNSTS